MEKQAVDAAFHVRPRPLNVCVHSRIAGTEAGRAGAPSKESIAPWCRVGNDSAAYGVNSFGPSFEVLDGTVVFQASQQGFL
jgi:hypothetical protein